MSNQNNEIFTPTEQDLIRSALALLDERTPIAPDLDHFPIAAGHQGRPHTRVTTTVALVAGFVVTGVLVGALALFGSGSSLPSAPGATSDTPDTSPIDTTVAPSPNISSETLPVETVAGLSMLPSPAEIVFTDLEAAVDTTVGCLEDLGIAVSSAQYVEALGDFVFRLSNGSLAKATQAESCIVEQYQSTAAVWAKSIDRHWTGDVPQEVASRRHMLVLHSVGDEPGWLCPARSSSSYREDRGAVQVVDQLRYIAEPAPTGLRLRIAGFSSSTNAPSCSQPPAVTLIEAGDGGVPVAVVAIWADVTGFEDLCPPPSCGFMGSVDTFEINGHPARLHTHEHGAFELWWIDGSGLPLRAEASGVDQDTLVDLAEAITADLTTNRLLVNSPTGPLSLEVVTENAATGSWTTGSWRLAYGEDETTLSARISIDPGFNPYAVLARNVTAIRLVDINGTPGAFIGDHGGFLFYEIADGVVATIEGVSQDEAIRFAAILVHVEPDDPRLP